VHTLRPAANKPAAAKVKIRRVMMFPP